MFKKLAALFVMMVVAVSPVLATGKSSKHRKPDRRPNHESKGKMVGGSGSSHKGGHFKPGARKGIAKPGVH